MIHAACLSYKRDLFNGVHQPDDAYRIALYTRPLDETATAYTPQGESSGQGYSPGGLALTGRRVVMDGTTAILDWDDPEWPLATIHARAALIYNGTRGNRALAVIDLEDEIVSTNGRFWIELPEPTATTGLLHVT